MPWSQTAALKNKNEKRCENVDDGTSVGHIFRDPLAMTVPCVTATSDFLPIISSPIIPPGTLNVDPPLLQGGSAHVAWINFVFLGELALKM